MPIIKSAKKRVEISLKKNLQKRIIKTGLSALVKKYRSMLDSKDIVGAEKLLPEVFSALDSAVSSNTIHANNAANKKAALAAKLDVLKKAAK